MSRYGVCVSRQKSGSERSILAGKLAVRGRFRGVRVVIGVAAVNDVRRLRLYLRAKITRGQAEAGERSGRNCLQKQAADVFTLCGGLSSDCRVQLVSAHRPGAGNRNFCSTRGINEMEW